MLLCRWPGLWWWVGGEFVEGGVIGFEGGWVVR